MIVALVLAIMLPAFAVLPTPAKAQPPFRSLRVGVGEDSLQIQTLNPLKFTLLYEFVVVYNVYSTLVTYDKSYRVVPDLATGWAREADSKNWTFQLVQNAYFTDPGNPADRTHPVTADDVVFTFNLLINTPNNYFENYVENITTVEKIDTYTVRLGFNEPLGVMMSVAAGVPILPQYVWSGVANPLNFRNDVPIGSGAMYYDFTNTTTTALVMRRNPNYYGDTVYCQFSRPDEVRYIGYTSSAVMVQSFLNGADRLDVIDHIAPSEFKVALAGWSPKFAVDTGFVGEIALNVMTPQIRQSFQQYRPGDNNQILLNYTVRKAIAMSIDKQALVDNALLGLGAAADTLVPSSNPWHYDIPSSDEFPFDTAAARAMLNAAGWTYDSAGTLDPNATPLYKAGGAEPLSFRFYTLNTATQWDIAARNITGWLRQTGIATTDRLGNTNPGYGLYSINQMNGYWYQADYDLWLWDWIFTPISDPSLDVMSVQLSSQIGGSGSSDNFYSNATFDALYYESLKVVEPVARRAITDQLQKMVYDYASYILPYYRYDLYAATPGRVNPLPGEFPGWTGYGDWERDRGLVDDSDLPNLFFQVSPLDNQAPTIQSFAPVQWVNGTPVTISVSAQDPETAALTYIWEFGDGSAPETTNSASVDHTFAQAGNFTIKVRVKDSEWPVCAATTATIVPPSPGANLPPAQPSLAYVLSHSTYEEPGKTITFNLTVRDPEGDDLAVTWDFGDGSTPSDTVTGTSTAKVVTRTHAYSAEGTYTLKIVVKDNKVGLLNHTVTLTQSILIQAVTPPSGPGPSGGNPWVDIGVPVAIVLIIVGAAAYVVMRRRSQAKEEQREEERGQTPPPPAPPP